MDAADTTLKHRKDPVVSTVRVNVTSGVYVSSTQAPGNSPSSTSTPSGNSGNFKDSQGNVATFYGDGDYLHLELVGAASQQWVALAFSKDKSMVSVAI